MPKPILKWVGGKTQILDTLLANFPKEMRNYREIFVGGGSVLLGLLSAVRNGSIKVSGSIYAYDANEPLIGVYKNIQTQHNELYDMLQAILSEFNECRMDGEIIRTPKTPDEATQNRENYYYWIRSQYNRLTNKTGLVGSAMFIFLNKTCFRGMFRVGPNGFNVPYGHYKNPEIINHTHLDEIHELIQSVVFEHCDFGVSLAHVEPDDFVYLDPPYAPETTTSFVGYTENGFGLEDHQRLFQTIDRLENARFMMSNSAVPLVSTHFPEEKYRILPLVCRRAIHSKHPDATTNEVVIMNF